MTLENPGAGPTMLNLHKPYEAPAGAGGGGRPDQDPRTLNRGSLDAISMPELSDLIEAKTPQEVRVATRGFVETIVETDRESFGADYKYDTQTYLKILKGLEKKAKREKQKPLETEYKRCAQEISVVSQLMYWMNTFNAVGKSMSGLGERFGDMSTGTLMYPEAFQKILTLPSIEGNRSVGSRIDKVIRACMVVGMCEDPKKLKALKNRPGWKLLFETPEAEKNFLGVIDEWDEARIVTTDSTTKLPIYDSLKKEKDGIKRKGIAEFGNLWARAETEEESIKFRNILLEIADNDDLAVSLGLGLFKIWAGDAENAAFIYKKDDKETVQFEGWPNSSDLAKLMHFEKWQKKQDAAGHPCGPKATRGNVRGFLTPFYKFAHFKIGEDDSTKRTLYEQMWGYSDEPAKRLGEIEWNKLTPDTWNDWGTRIAVPGGEKSGLFLWLKTERGNVDDLMSVEFWEKMTLNLNIAINEQLVCEGEFRGKDPAKIADTIKARRRKIMSTFWEGVKSLPDYDIWSAKPIVDNAGKWGSHLGEPMKDYIKDTIWKSVGIDYLSV